MGMSSTQQKSAAKSLESGLEAQWVAGWTKVTGFTGNYDARTKAAAEIVGLVAPGTPLTATTGKTCLDAYKHAKDNKADNIIAIFDRKIAAALALHVSKI